MKKVVVASLLACAVAVPGARSAYAQQPVQLGAQPGQIQLDADEAAAYTAAQSAATPQAKATAYEAFLTKYPQSTVKLYALQDLAAAYSGFDPAKTLDASNRILALDPNNIRAFMFEAYFGTAAANAIADPAAKQAQLDAAAGFAQKGLAAPKPKDMDDAAFKTLMTPATPIFYAAIGAAALNKKDSPTAIDAYKKELAAVPVAQTQSAQLPDTYSLGVAYFQSTPPDLLNCAYYMSRFVAFAPEPYKSQVAPSAKYCYRKYHGAEDGYDAFMAAAAASLDPTPTLFSSIAPAPTPAEKIHKIIETTPDLSVLAFEDREMIFQYGSPEDATKVLDAVKGKSTSIPNALVIESSPTVVKVAVTEDAVQNKAADFTFNMKPAEEPPAEPAASALPAVKLAYKKKLADYQKEQAAIAAAITVGSKVTLQGTYASFTSNPVMTVMNDGEVILPAPTKATPAKPATPVHRPAAAH
jgi:hypothetical protein